MNLVTLQNQVFDWSQKNFPDSEPWMPLVGLMEELGELSHAHLKQVQRICTDEDHEAKRRDAVGDIVVYLAGYCARTNLDLATCVDASWGEVQQRNWIKNPRTGKHPVSNSCPPKQPQRITKPSPPELLLLQMLQRCEQPSGINKGVIRSSIRRGRIEWRAWERRPESTRLVLTDLGKLVLKKYKDRY